MNEPVKLAPVERIFKRMAATYGAAWDRSLGQTPIEDVMTAWANELGGFLQSKKAMNAISWALDNLPDTCPNVMQFRAICRRAPATVLAALPAPAADPKIVARELARMRAMFRTPRTHPTDKPFDTATAFLEAAPYLGPAEGFDATGAAVRSVHGDNHEGVIT